MLPLTWRNAKSPGHLNYPPSVAGPRRPAGYHAAVAIHRPPPSVVVRTRLMRYGLANRLFPWARATVYTELHGYSMLPPRWTQVKVGPLLRGERDPRLYAAQFRRDPRHLSRAYRVRCANWPEVREPNDLGEAMPADARVVVLFTTFRRYFRPIEGHEPLLTQRLLRATRTRRLPAPSELTPIVAHVRRSDFGDAMTPLAWFERRIGELRAAGVDAPVGIITDGRNDEVGPLLELPGVRLIRTGSAIGDLWVAAASQALIASSHSTFSAWAAFLGGQPVTYLADGDFVGLEDARPHQITASATNGDASRFVKQVIESVGRPTPVTTALSARRRGDG